MTKRLFITKDVELRASDTRNEMIVEGYALKFDEQTNLWGDVYETIDRAACDEADFSDVVLCVNHDLNQVVARTTANNLSLEVDDIGLKVRATLADTTVGRDLYENIKSGLLNAMSFAAYVTGRSYEWPDDGSSHITITKFGRFFDVSAVVFAAYPQTEIDARQEEIVAERSRMNGENMPSPNEGLADLTEVRAEEVATDIPVETEDATNLEQEDAGADEVPATEETASSEDVERKAPMPKAPTRIDRSLTGAESSGLAYRGKNFTATERSEFYDWAEAVRRGVNTADHGEVIPTVVANAIETAIREGGTIVSLCNVTSLAGITSVAIETGRSDAKWKAEGSGTTEGTITLGEAILNPKFVQEWIDITAEFEALAIEAWAPYLLDTLTDRILVALDSAILTGAVDVNGKGIDGVSHASDLLAPKVPVLAVGWNSAYPARKHIKRGNPIIAMNSATFYDDIVTAEGTDGRPVYTESVTAGGASEFYYCGMKVIFTDELPAFAEAAEGDAFAIVGDFKGYWLNFPAGFGVRTVRDEITQLKEGIIRYLGRVFAAGAVTKLGSFAVLTKDVA